MHPYTIMALSWAFCAVWIGFVIMTNRKAHPKALFYLFFVEMWERFSYYGMRALLVLYMTKGFLEYSTAEAFGTYGSYGSLVYATPLLGGLLAEQFMGYRRAIMWGALLMMVGHFLMAFEHEYIFLTALSMLILGNGFFKPNISTMIGKFYAKKDPRRDGAFTIFYMGINIGAFLTGLTCGVVGEIEGWHWGFSLAGVGMLVGLIIFTMAQRSGALEDKGFAPFEVTEVQPEAGTEDTAIPAYAKTPNPVVPTLFGISVNLIIYVASLLAIPLIWLLISHHEVLDIGLLFIGVGMVGYLLVSSFKYDKVQRQRLWVVVTLFFFAIIFWTFFELAGSALTVFTDNNIKKTGFLTTTMFQSLNPLFIMLFAPIFSWIWFKLAQANREPSAPLKFGIALVLLGIGFWMLNLGYASAESGMIPAIFMVLLYLLHTLGELALSPVGLSLVTKLSPMSIVGFVMGFWLMSSSFAHQAGARIAQMTNVDMSVLFEDAERLKRFETSMTDNHLKTAFLNNKELYKAFVGENKTEDCVKLYGSDSTMIELCKEGHSVQEFVTSSYFVAKLNEGLPQPQYFVATIADAEIMKQANASTNEVYKKKLLREAVTTFLSNDSTLVVVGDQKPIEKSKEEIAKLIETSPNAIINKCIAEDTLVICLGVFYILGFFAGGAGIVLILSSFFIARWMHGIK